MISSRKLWGFAGLVGVLFTAACGSDADSMSDGSSGSAGAGGSGGQSGAAGNGGSGGAGESSATTFEILIENVSGSSALPTPFAPGVSLVHSATDPIFTSGVKDRDDGLVSLAEDGDPSTLASSLKSNADVSEVAVFNTPQGASAPAPIVPGERYSFSVAAEPGDRLSLASMLVQSNDLFISPEGRGIALFDNAGMPVSGNVSMSLGLWDVGSEHNEAPGQGPSQAPRQMKANYGSFGPSGVALLDGAGMTRSEMDIQADVKEMLGAFDAGTEANQAGARGPAMAPLQAGPNTGDAEGDGTVRPVSDVWSYPMPYELVRVTITPR